MTERLYYNDAYLTEFESSVSAVNSEGFLAFKKSAFYPTSGGQPHDLGYIIDINKPEEKIAVRNVIVDDEGIVWHKADKELRLGTKIKGFIDFERRFDHMQQHAGEHILAGCIYNMFNGVTQGLHLGVIDSTIDVLMPDGRQRLEKDEILALENLANSRIQQGAPIKCWFPSDEELKTLPLRKPSSVEEHVRVVQAGDFEMVPCGGTHPKNTGELGLIKIKSISPAKDKMRVQFVVGKRAVNYVQMLYENLSKISLNLSCSMEDSYKNIEGLKEQISELKIKNSQIESINRENTAKNLCEKASSFGSEYRLIAEYLNGYSMHELQLLAGEIIKNKGFIALLSSSSSPYNIVFAASEDVEYDMNALLKRLNIKGGGRKNFAQGSCDIKILNQAVVFLSENA